MVNEMGNTKSSQRANHGDDVRGRNIRTKQQGGERKDVHEKVEGPKGGDHPPVAMRTLDDKEQDDTKLKVSSQPAEVLPMESTDEASQGGMIQPAASPADNLEKEPEPNLEENLVVKKEEEASNSTADTGSDLPGSSITEDRQETETKDEVTGFDNKSSEASSLETPSNNVEEVPQTKDESVALSEDKDKMDVSENEDNGKENGENTVLMETAPVMETVPTELPATEGNNEEEEIKEKKVIEQIEKQEVDAGISPSAAEEAEDSGAVELRKSQSFGFDVSMEGEPGESDQTPLLHLNKNRTRNPSLFDGSKGVEDLTQTDQAVSAEEKTIEVAISDSDRSKAMPQNIMKEEPQKQDCEKKGVEEPKTGTSKEVASTEPKPRPSPLKKFLCCAA